jgi:hypothetical protein
MMLPLHLWQHAIHSIRRKWLCSFEIQIQRSCGRYFLYYKRNAREIHRRLWMGAHQRGNLRRVMCQRAEEEMARRRRSSCSMSLTMFEESKDLFLPEPEEPPGITFFNFSGRKSGPENGRRRLRGEGHFFKGQTDAQPLRTVFYVFFE